MPATLNEDRESFEQFYNNQFRGSEKVVDTFKENTVKALEEITQILDCRGWERNIKDLKKVVKELRGML